MALSTRALNSIKTEVERKQTKRADLTDKIQLLQIELGLIDNDLVSLNALVTQSENVQPTTDQKKAAAKALNS